jgi:hypothetical protein
LVELAGDTCKLDKEGAPGLDMLAEVFDQPPSIGSPVALFWKPPPRP